LPEWPGMISCLQDMLCDEEWVTRISWSRRSFTNGYQHCEFYLGGEKVNQDAEKKLFARLNEI
jgi:hypothetical protein